MKSELKKSDKSTYPALYEYRGAVILFENCECGTVVIGTGNYPFGDYCDSLDVTDWQRLPSGSQVILTQD